MTTLQIIQPTVPRNPRLAVKSSLPNLRSAIGWLILIYLGSSRPDSCVPMIQNEDNLEMSPELWASVSTLLTEDGNIPAADIDEIMSTTVESNFFLKLQMEPLQVAFELFIPLAQFEFESSEISNSSERTGRKRYPKRINFSAAIDRLALPVGLAPTEILKFLVELILNREPQNHLLLRHFQETCFDLISNTVFRLEPADDPEIFFNTIGLYTVIITDGEVSLSGKEPKGPLRVLKSAISSEVLPGLTSRGNLIFLKPEQDVSELKALISRSMKSHELTFVGRTSVEKGIGLSETKPDSIVEHDVAELLHNLNTIVYGVPGSGKSFLVNKEFCGQADLVQRVVFHPDFLYAQFVGQILPDVKDGSVSYAFSPGPFTRALKNAIENPNQRHVFVIEEINRGNAAAIFGDVFQLLDRDKDGRSQYSIQNPDVANYLYGDPNAEIRIPGNLQLVATMNTSDQNVNTLDNAFQRRWSMRIVPNNLDDVSFGNSRILDTSLTWKDFAKVANSLIVKISDGLSSNEDKRIGAYFVEPADISPENLPDSAAWFAEKVIKYLWDDAFRFDRSRFFSRSEGRSLEDVLVRFETSHGDERWRSILSDQVLNLLPFEPVGMVEELPENDG